MPSFHVSGGNMPQPLCLRCGTVLSQSLYCTRCGYTNEGAQTNISAQETQPSPAFNEHAKGFTAQSGAQLDAQRKEPHSIPTHLSQYLDLPTQNMPSVTPFLGIDPNTPYRPNLPTQHSGPSVTPFLGIAPGLVSQPGESFQQQYSKLSTKNVSSVTPFLGIAPQASVSQQAQPRLSITEPPYTTQPTLIIPAGIPEGRKSVVQGATKRRKSSSPKKLLAIVIVVIMLIGGSLGGYLFVVSSASSKRIGEATPFTQPKEQPGFEDAFKDNNNQWNLQSEAGKYSVAITNGNLILEDDANSLLPEVLPGNKVFSNFKMSVDAILSKGDIKSGYGVYVRCGQDRDGSPATYYRLELYGDSTYAIFKGMLDEHRKASASPLKLVNYTANGAIYKQGKINHIEINAQDTGITVRVNGQVLKTFSDTSYTSGTIALFISNVQNTPPGAQAKFSNLVIHPEKEGVPNSATG